VKNDTNYIEFQKLEVFLKGRYFIYSALTLCFLLVSLCIYNIVYLFEVFKNNFLLFYSIVYYVIEGIRTAIIVWLVIVIIRFVINSRKKGYLDSLYIEKIIRVLTIGLIAFVMTFIILFYQVYLTHVFASILFILIISGSCVVLILYINQIKALPIDDGKPIPNPTGIVAMLLVIFVFLIFHYQYRSLGGYYSIVASRAYFYLAIPFMKYILLILIDFSLINLILSLFFSTQPVLKKRYVYSILAASMTLFVFGVMSAINVNTPNFVVTQYENDNKSPLSSDVLIFTKDFLIYPVATNYSGQVWSGRYWTHYDFIFYQQTDLDSDTVLIPSIAALDTVSLTIPNTAKIHEIVLYDEEDQIIDTIDSWEGFSELPSGDYEVNLTIWYTTDTEVAVIDYVFVLIVK
jgi:hypothetical protein